MRNLSRADSRKHTHTLGKDVPKRTEPTQGHCVKIGTVVDGLVKRKGPPALLFRAPAAPHTQALGNTAGHARFVAGHEARRRHVRKACEVLATLLLGRARLVYVQRGFHAVDDEGVGLSFARRVQVKERAQVILP